MLLQQDTAEDIELSSIKNRIADAKKKVQNCIKAIENRIVSETLANTLSSNETLLKDLEVQFAKAKIRTESGKITEEKIRFFFDSINMKATTSARFKTILFKCFIKKVLADNDIIEVQYNYDGDLSSSQMVILVGLFGFEPKTSSMSTKRSNQLSYNPMSDECIIHDMREICKMLFAISCIWLVTEAVSPRCSSPSCLYGSQFRPTTTPILSASFTG